jgi:hypothetical protein
VSDVRYKRHILVDGASNHVSDVRYKRYILVGGASNHVSDVLNKRYILVDADAVPDGVVHRQVLGAAAERMHLDPIRYAAGAPQL